VTAEPLAGGVRKPLSPREGWGVLHLFFRVTPALESDAVLSALKVASGDDHQVVTAAMLGHKADLAVMGLGPDLVRLRRLQSALVAAGLELAWSYVSLTEVSEYSRALPPERKAPRLYPRLPPAGLPAFCFYPMSKRRVGEDNWYRLPYEERRRLMGEHGGTGKRFAGRVVQLVTGSTGLDDWEWGVTLFAERPDDLKDVVYTMRYDEASARYAEFGPFYVGMIAAPDEALALATSG